MLKVGGILLALMLVLTGCGSLAGILEAVPASTPEGANPAEAEPEVAPQLDEMVICIDRSGSYRFTEPALEAVADMLTRMAEPGREASVHLRWIEENSYRPEAFITTLKIPALPSPPPEVHLDDNPFNRRLREEQQASHDAQMVAYEAEAADVRAKVKESADAVRAAAWQPANSTDVWGCIQKAGELVDGAASGWLVIASDMEMAGVQQKATVSLAGVRVHVVFWQADTALGNEELQAEWRQTLGDAGAAEVTFHDPSRGLDGVFEEYGKAKR